jgi:hypothetical protein
MSVKRRRNKTHRFMAVYILWRALGKQKSNDVKSFAAYITG